MKVSSKCFDCPHSSGGGYPEEGDGYTSCNILEEIVFFQYSGSFEDLDCPLPDVDNEIGTN